MELTGTTIQPGEGRGPILVVAPPVSFWGGVDPKTGTIADPRHPQYRESVGGRILVMDRTIGSSSSSAIMLELLRNGVAPVGMVLGATDAILVLGILVARELGYPTIPVLELGPHEIDTLKGADSRWGTLAGNRLVVGPNDASQGSEEA